MVLSMNITHYMLHFYICVTVTLQMCCIPRTACQNFEQQEQQWLTRTENAVRKKVAIVGGGVAGLSALKNFIDKKFYDVILLEAQDRLGGRIKTYREGDILVEDGAEWIHGGPRNPVYRIAKQLGKVTKLPPEDDYVEYFLRESGNRTKDDEIVAQKVESFLDDAMENGVLESFYGQGYGSYFVHRFEEEIQLKLQPEVKKAWLHYLEQVINSDEGTENWNDISARESDVWVYLGKDHKWVDGYDNLVTHLQKSIPETNILLDAAVDHISWDRREGGVLLATKNQSFLVDKVLITASVGYLKKMHNKLFQPPIPNPLLHDLQHVTLGGPNKIFIAWPNTWWDDTNQTPVELHILWTKFDLPAEKDWLYGIHDIFSVEYKPNILLTFVAGTYSYKMEALEENQVKDDLLFLLQKFWNKDIPAPSFFRRTTWNSEIWSYGSYSSHITPKGWKEGITTRAPLRQPLRNTLNKRVVHWAGEHTHDTRYGTVDGALDSGIRESNKILNDLGKKLGK